MFKMSSRALALIYFIIAHDPSTTPPRPSVDVYLPAFSLTPLSPLHHSSLYLPIRPHTSLPAPVPPGSYSSFVRTLSDKVFRAGEFHVVRPCTPTSHELLPASSPTT